MRGNIVTWPLVVILLKVLKPNFVDLVIRQEETKMAAFILLPMGIRCFVLKEDTKVCIGLLVKGS